MDKTEEEEKSLKCERQFKWNFSDIKTSTFLYISTFIFVFSPCWKSYNFIFVILINRQAIGFIVDKVQDIASFLYDRREQYMKTETKGRESKE